MITRWYRAAAVGLAASAITTLAACGGSSSEHHSDSLKYALASDPGCLDVAKSTGNSVLTGNILDSLVYQRKDGTFAPWLAKSWTISPDGKVYTFHLRSGVTFSDNTPLDAAAVKYNLDRIVAPATGSAYAASLIGTYESSRVVDPLTIEVTLKQATTSLLQGLSLAYLGIQSPTALRQHGADTCTSIVGSGAYVLSDFTAGQQYRLTKRKGYNWPFDGATHTGEAKIGTVTYTVNKEDTVRVNGLTSKQFDLIQDLPTAQLASLKTNPAITVYNQNFSGIPVALALNAQSPILSDINVRKAFQSSVDVAKLVPAATFHQYPGLTTGPFDPTTRYFDPTVKGTYGYDPARANQLLDAAGWTQRNADGIRVKDGKPLALNLLTFPSIRPEQETLIQSIQQAVRPIGFQLNFQTLDSGTWNKRINAGDYDIQVHSYFRAEPDIARTVYSQRFIPPNGYTFARPNDPTLESLLNRGAATPDGPAREAIYHEIQHRVIDQAYSLPLYSIFRSFAYTKSLKGFAVNGTGVPFLYNLSYGD
ncbi:MAG: ABC transporter substrate-binding protein [Gordonia sp. (in: high G+C Gram-positive bacteria)]